MNEWILLVPMLAFAVLALAGWLVAWRMQRDLNMALAGYTAIKEEKKLLYAQNADLREACQECRAEVENLRHERDTVQLQLDEALLVPKARPVRVKKVENGQ